MHSITGVVRGRGTVIFAHQWSHYALTIPKALFFLIDAIFAGTAIANRISDQRVTENVVRTKLGGTGSLTSFRGESFSIPEGDFLRSCGVVK